MYRVKDLIRGPRASQSGKREEETTFPIYVFALIEAFIIVDIVMHIFSKHCPKRKPLNPALLFFLRGAGEGDVKWDFHSNEPVLQK